MANIRKYTAILLSALLLFIMAVPVFAMGGGDEAAFVASATVPKSGSATSGTTAGATVPQTMPTQAYAPVYVNPNTGYEVYIEDDADLMTPMQEQELLDYMWQITDYGNVAFKSIDYNPKSNTASYAESYYHEKFGTVSGTVFIIDMDERNIYIFSDGAIYKTVTKGRANTITDNTYKYATQELYTECAEQSFWQIYTILTGNEIAQPMRYITSILLALMIALVVNFLVILRVASVHKTSNRQMIQAAEAYFQSTPTEAIFMNETKTYSPVQTSGGGGGSHGGGGHGGGGGGHSGGGGGHGF